MINSTMTQKRGHRLSKLPGDRDLWVPNNLLTPEQKKNTSVEPRWAKKQTICSGPNQIK